MKRYAGLCGNSKKHRIKNRRGNNANNAAGDLAKFGKELEDTFAPLERLKVGDLFGGVEMPKLSDEIKVGLGKPT